MAAVLWLVIAAGVKAAAPAGGGALDASVRHSVVESFAKALAHDYPYPNKGAAMAAEIRRRAAAGAYGQLSSPEGFAHALQADARKVVNDVHLRVYYRPAWRRSGGLPRHRLAAKPNPITINGGISKLEILPHNVGYMRVNAVPELKRAKKPIDAAFAFLCRTNALILDLRGNLGGSPRTVAYYVSHLVGGPPRVIESFHFRQGDRMRVKESWTTNLGAAAYAPSKPVVVLVSHHTVSGGEELAYDLQSFKRALVVGEVTAGGANPGRLEPLGHGFATFMPRGYPLNPITGTNWEGVGVKPNIQTRASDALTVAEQLVTQRLGNSPAAPRMKNQAGSRPGDGAWQRSKRFDDTTADAGPPTASSPGGVAPRDVPDPEWRL